MFFYAKQHLRKRAVGKHAVSKRAVSKRLKAFFNPFHVSYYFLVFLLEGKQKKKHGHACTQFAWLLDILVHSPQIY